MALKDIFKVSFRTYFNPTAWLGLRDLRAYNRIITDTIKQMFATNRPMRTESFAQALKRNHLQEDSLKTLINSYKVNKFIFYVLTIASFCASFYYLINNHSVAGWILCIAVTALFLSQAFRYSFWLFQIQHRKLGCTFAEWWQGKIHETKD